MTGWTDQGRQRLYLTPETPSSDLGCELRDGGGRDEKAIRRPHWRRWAA
jgi:hypothetical protein